jgi:hypothetical protein
MYRMCCLYTAPRVPPALLVPQVQLMAEWLDGCIASAWMAHADAMEAAVARRLQQDQVCGEPVGVLVRMQV